MADKDGWKRYCRTCAHFKGNPESGYGECADNMQGHQVHEHQEGCPDWMYYKVWTDNSNNHGDDRER